MNFELSSQDHDSLEPLREELDQGGLDWKVRLDVLEGLVKGNQNLEEMFDDVLDQCLRYTKTVKEEQETLLKEGRGSDYAEKDVMRSITHTATQDTIRAFTRNLIQGGIPEEKVFSVLPSSDSRSACGKFALAATLSRL